MKHYGQLKSLALLIVMASCTAFGQNIVGFSGGIIDFDTHPGGRYRVDWKSQMTDDEWRSESFSQAFTATDTVSSINIPMFYRVTWLNPPPYSISGFISFAGHPITNIVGVIYAEEIESGYQQQTQYEMNGAYSIHPVSNGTYKISTYLDGYFSYSEDVSVLDEDLAHNINLELPIQPIWPTNHHVQASQSITLEWPDDQPIQWTHISYYRVTSEVGPIWLVTPWHTNSYTLGSLEPGLYRWYARFYTFGTGQIPVGRFEQWYEFTIDE